MSKNLFTEKEKQQIVSAIKEAEKNTSGEIRVHIERKCKEDVLDHAAFMFESLEMHKTKQRNGVLIYLAYEDKQLAILGDAGINQKVPQNFWEDVKNLMVDNFKKGNFAEGLSEGIIKSGEQLKTHFPYQKDDVNELTDEISFGE